MRFVLKHVSNLSVLAMVLTLEHCPSLNQELLSSPSELHYMHLRNYARELLSREAVLKMPLLSYPGMKYVITSIIMYVG